MMRCEGVLALFLLASCAAAGEPADSDQEATETVVLRIDGFMKSKSGAI